METKLWKAKEELELVADHLSDIAITLEGSSVEQRKVYLHNLQGIEQTITTLKSTTARLSKTVARIERLVETTVV